VPFSKYHNYNEAIRLFKDGNNSIVGQVDKEIIRKFCNAIGFDFATLSYLPFYHNDVAYKISTTEYDKLGGRRFIKQIKKVE
jgi:hypothetical protein